MSELVWTCLNLDQLVWTCLNLFELVWTCLNLFELVYTCLNLFELVWTCLNLSELVWTCLNLSELVWTCLNLFELVWTCLNLSELVWTCLNLFELVGTCLNMSEIVWTCLNLLELENQPLAENYLKYLFSKQNSVFINMYCLIFPVSIAILRFLFVVKSQWTKSFGIERLVNIIIGLSIFIPLAMTLALQYPVYDYIHYPYNYCMGRFEVLFIPLHQDPVSPGNFYQYFL